MSSDQTKGAAKELGGSIKDAAGNLTGNERLEAQGTSERIEGKTQKNIGKIEGAVKDQFN